MTAIPVALDAARAQAVATGDDRALLGHLREGRDAIAIAETLRRHAGLVHGACLRRLPAGQAAALCEAVFATLVADPLAVSGPLPIWLHRQVLERSAGREGIAPAGAEGDWARVAPQLDAALADLPAEDRDRLLARFCCLPPRDAGGGTIRRGDEDRLDASIGLLVEGLGRRGVALDAAALGACLDAEAIAVPMGDLAGRLGRLALGALPATSSGEVGSVEKRYRLYVGIAVVLAVLVLIGGATVWGIALFGPKKAAVESDR